MNLKQLNSIAIKAALSAGKVIRKVMNDDVLVEHKNGGSSYASQVVTAVDKECEKAILKHLLPTCEEYDLALITEETEDDGSRFLKDFFWCIDPLDGTLPFINKRPGYSVSIALVSKEGTPIIGVVLDPSTDKLYHATKGNGAFKNGRPLEIINTNDHLSYVTDRPLKESLRSSEIEDVAKKYVEKLELTGVKEISGGGAVLNAIHVIESGPAFMLKYPKREPGGGSIWDFAATACIYHELDLTATNYEGGKLDLNRKDDTYMNHQGIFFSNFQ